MRIYRIGLWIILLVSVSRGADDVWQQAQLHGRQSQRAIQFCGRYAQGWLSHADSRSGLLPRMVTRESEAYWNAKDCAADNYPFLVLTAAITDNYHLKRTSLFLLEQEQKLTNRLDSLPDDFLFATQTFRSPKYDLTAVIFGAAEYCKDGLMPVTEWVGPGPWSARMEQLLRDVFKHAPIEDPCGRLPSQDVEVNGDLLQVASRLYWMTGRDEYRDWAFRLADHYLLHDDLLKKNSLRLRDHGSEIVGGLSEACVIASVKDPPRWQKYKPKMRAILDRILEIGVNENGMMYNVVNPRDGKVVDRNLSDSWGYVYNAFMTIAAIDPDERYRKAAAHALSSLHKYKAFAWEGTSADGYADSIEGTINLFNRLADRSAMAWADEEIVHIFEKQRPDGILEGWYGDGNSTRTSLMYALWKTQGIAPAPWRDDLQAGAVREADGTARLLLQSDFDWSGRLRFDKPRHRDVFHMPFDYPRINQFPEWFTVDPDHSYWLQIGDSPARQVAGRELYELPVKMAANTPLRITVSASPPATTSAVSNRSMRYTPRSADQARAWQKDLRGKLSKLLRIDDAQRQAVPLNPRQISEQSREGYLMRELEISSTPGRRIRVLVTMPIASQPTSGPYPAIVCIHGHGGNRAIVYDPKSPYAGFAGVLARSGVVTISTDVGQHEVYEAGRTLMGERLQDVMRCVDYLWTMPEVDRKRIGCAGLSLGGELAMWLGAMDERVAATSSCGFLTRMDQMEHDHCMCWKFDGLRELVDFADIYSLIAPRDLQCQNGEKEPPNMFTVALAREALREIQPIYADLGRPDAVSLAVHPGEHVVDVPLMLSFFEKSLGLKQKG